MGYIQYDPEVLKRIQKEELEIIKEFIRICEKYHLKYFGLFGTSIGAVRHHGFIPWDDDMDFGMLRDDYEKFKKVAPKEFNGRYDLAGPDCKKMYYNCLTQMYKKGTSFITNYNHGKFEMGISIDIFVYDNLAETPKEQKRQIFISDILKSMYMSKNVNFYKNSVFKEGNFLKRLASGAVYYIWKVIPVTNRFLAGLWKKNATRYHGKTNLVTQFNDWGVWESRIAMEDLLPLTDMPFEDITLKLPKNYDKVMREMYGDYMQLPPPEKRQNHYPYILKFEGEDKVYGTSVQGV